jgi:hypothetical protein
MCFVASEGIKDIHSSGRLITTSFIVLAIVSGFGVSRDVGMVLCPKFL